MNKILVVFVVVFFFSDSLIGQSLQGKRICIDPGHGGTALTDFYRVGKRGEREEWVNLRVAKYLEEMLIKEGANVKMTRTDDIFVELQERAKISHDFLADIFISIHHNGTADTSVNYPVIYFHGSKLENKASTFLGELLVKELNTNLFQDENSKYAIVSDYLIFPNRGAYVLRGTYGIPSIIGEASYFTNENEELRLKEDSYNKIEALCYFNAIKKFFELPQKEILPEGSISKNIYQLPVNQESNRMQADAVKWSSKIDYAQEVIANKDIQQYTSAKDSLLMVMKLFPDNYRVQSMYSSLITLFQFLNDTDQHDLFLNRYENYVYTIN